MKYKLFSKKGMIVFELSTYFLNIKVGEKLLSINSLAKNYGVGRGTIQTAINDLSENDIISIQKMGRNGTILIKKDIHKLLKIINKDTIIGCMPLPYTKRYEGLATAIVCSLKKQCQTNVNMSYVKNSFDRVALLNNNRVDFAIISEFHASKVTQEFNNIEILVDFKQYSYLSKHVIIKNKNNIFRVGVDANSYVHSVLIEENFRNVELVHIEYSNLNKALIKNEIDATIINFDDFFENGFSVTSIIEDVRMTKACILINKENMYLKNLIDENTLISSVYNIQREVLLENLDPRF